MKTLSLLAFCLLADPPQDLASQADAAYQAKDYPRCGEVYEKLSAEGNAKQQMLNHWNAACCFALAKRPDRAFQQLDQTLAVARPEPKELDGDADLASLHADPRWAPLLKNAQAKLDAYEKSLAQPALRKELLTMKEVDQAARQAQVKASFKDEKANKHAEAVDRANTKRMKEIVAKGWPGKSQVGEDGAAAAWLLVQHADLDLPFQKLCLAKLEEAKNKGDADPASWAYLVDRVAVAEKRMQVYGTQFDNQLEPRPIEDPAHVDERRKSVGLSTLAEYREQMKKAYAPK